MWNLSVTAEIPPGATDLWVGTRFLKSARVSLGEATASLSPREDEIEPGGRSEPEEEPFINPDSGWPEGDFLASQLGNSGQTGNLLVNSEFRNWSYGEGPFISSGGYLLSCDDWWQYARGGASLTTRKGVIDVEAPGNDFTITFGIMPSTGERPEDYLEVFSPQQKEVQAANNQDDKFMVHLILQLGLFLSLQCIFHRTPLHYQAAFQPFARLLILLKIGILLLPKAEPSA